MLILAAGMGEKDGPDGAYPLLLTEFERKPLIQLLIEKAARLAGSRISVALLADEVKRHHLDDVLKLIDPEVRIASIENVTRGATCTALLAIEHIDPEGELLVVNGDELLDIDYYTAITEFRERGWDAGALVFPSVHPRYSYLRLDTEGLVLEAAEKRPISRNATTGFYWYKEGSAFLRAAMEQIRNGDVVDGHFFICPTLNYVILEGGLVGAVTIEAANYHPLKTTRQVEKFDDEIDARVPKW